VANFQNIQAKKKKSSNPLVIIFLFCFHAENSAIHDTFAKKIRKVLPPHFSGAPIAPASKPLA
jgi:hypothetical protein